VEVLLRDLLITSLARAGVKQAEIRRIAGCDMNQVSRIVKHIERGR
jgi:predicted transcriptional regulator